MEAKVQKKLWSFFSKFSIFQKSFSFVTSFERGWVGSESPSFLKKVTCEAHLKYQGI